MSTTNYAVSPGEYVNEWLEDNDITKEQLSCLTGVSEAKLDTILCSEPAPLEEHTAVLLSQVINIGTHVLMKMERQYRADIKRLGTNQE